MPLEGFFNRSSDEVTTHTLDWTNGGDELFAAKMRFSPAWTGNYSAAAVPTDQNDGMTIEVDANGGTSSEVELVVTEVQLDETGSAGSNNTFTVNGAAYTTLGEFIQEANKSTGLTGNVELVATNAPHDFDTGTALWIDTTAGTEVPLDGRWTNILNINQGSAPNNTECFLRIGYPEIQDTGRLGVLRISTRIAHGGAGTVKLYRDEFNAAGTAPTLLLDLGATGATGVQTTHLDHNKLEASVFRGPLLLGIEGVTSMTACTADVSTICAEW